MQKSIEMTGATRDIAIEKALEFLHMDRDDVSVEVLDNGKKGFLGIGAADAKIRVKSWRKSRRTFRILRQATHA